MPGDNLDDLSNLLESTNLKQLSKGVSFAKKGLKINKGEDAKDIIAAMQACGPDLEYLELEGNTLGVEGAIAIGKQLENHPKIKKALWKDMFTGRSKEEIPPALIALSNGLMAAKAELEVLDLSDNASGPIGVDGIKDLIKSPTCYTLKELRMNNMGLGITGGKMLASALTECFNKSENAGKPLQLKVFVAGRNRLEDEATKAFAQLFSMLGSLEEVQMPQNGMRDTGASALFQSFALNSDLKILNLNDNTLKKAVPELVKIIPILSNLVHLDLGNCLLLNAGALELAEALAGLDQIEDICLSGNEISASGGIAIVKALIGNPSIKSIKLGENQLGMTGIESITEEARKFDKENIVNLSDDEGDDDEDIHSDIDDDDEDEDDDDDEDGSEDDESDLENKYGSYGESFESDGNGTPGSSYPNNYSANDYQSPLRRNMVSTQENPLETSVLDSSLCREKTREIITNVKARSKDVDQQVKNLLGIVTSISTNYKSADETKKTEIEDCAIILYQELFKLATDDKILNNINNLLPAYIGIIKNEDKTPLVKFYDKESCLILLKTAMSKDFFPQPTRDVINFVIQLKKP